MEILQKNCGLLIKPQLYLLKSIDKYLVQMKDGTLQKPQVLSGTWAFKLKWFPSGILKKVKARFCAQGDQQEDVDVFDTYAPVASWSSMQMLTVLAMQKGWKTRQIDFSNAFVQAPMQRDVYVSLPAMFDDTKGIPAKDLCLKLRKSLYGLREKYNKTKGNQKY